MALTDFNIQEALRRIRDNPNDSGFHGLSPNEFGGSYYFPTGAGPRDGLWLVPISDGQTFDQSSGLFTAGPQKAWRVTQDLGKANPGMSNAFGGGGSAIYEGAPWIDVDPRTGAVLGNGAFENMGTDTFTDVGSWITALASMMVAGGAVAGTAAAGAGGGAAGSGAGFVGEGAASGIGAWDAALANAPAWSAGGTAAGTGAFNAAVDSQAANAAIDAAGGNALSGYTAAGVPSTVSPSVMSGLQNILKGAGVSDWTSLIGPITSLIGGGMSANAAGKSADQLAQSQREALALYEKMFNKNIELNEPFRSAGVQGINRMSDLLGLSGNTGATGYGSLMKPFGMADFQADPGYSFRQGEGMKALDRAAAAGGRFNSGRSMKDILRFSQGLASDEYGKAEGRYRSNQTDQFNRLASITGTGQTATSQMGNAAQNYGNQAGNAIGNIGQANAAGTVGSANAWNNAIGQGYSMYQNSNLMNRLLQG